MTDEEYAPADMSSSLSDAPSSSPALIPSASPKPSPTPSNSPAPSILAWREWLGICGLPYTFDYFAPPLIYQPDNNSCGPLAIRSLSLAVRGHVGVTYRVLEGNKPSLALNIDGRRDTAQAEAELRYYDWVPIPWEIESKEDMQKQRDMAYSLMKLAMLEELGSIDGSFQRQKTNKEGKLIGLMRKVYAGTEGELTLIRGITQNITEDDMFSRFGGYNHIFITRLGRETGFRGRHELEKAGSFIIQGVATWRKESLCEESPRTTLARMKDPQAKRLSALGMAVRGPVPDDGKAISRAGSPMVIDLTD
ncbi:hypothetical protein DER46DRAFT_665718 [Fusarium sp. MPI-SDFR-AT-0072]|nr:hypothetical protein DER46DRAFT_665718 [Fusarium sp. MPI-SDFR-AT-0072]